MGVNPGATRAPTVCSVRLLVGAVGGAVIAFLLASVFIPPGREEIVAAGEDFAPPGLSEFKADPATGSPLIVGHDFYVVVDMESAGRGELGLAQDLVNAATGNGWMVVTTGRLGPMRTYEFARWPMTAEARVGYQVEQGEPTDTGTAQVIIDEDEDAIFRAIAGVSVLGAAAGVGAALLLGRITTAGPRPTQNELATNTEGE